MKDVHVRERKKVWRLRKTSSIAAEMLEELTALSKDEGQTAAGRRMALLTKAELVMTMLNASSAEARARLKFADTDDEPKEPKDSKAPPVPKESQPLTFEERLARVTGKKEE